MPKAESLQEWNTRSVLRVLTAKTFDMKPARTVSVSVNALKTNGRTYTDLWVELEEHGGENGDGAFENFTSACLEKIERASAKAYLVERWKKWKGL